MSINNVVRDCLIWWGFLNPFGKCPQCGKGFRYTTERTAVKQPDGKTCIRLSCGVKCPKCGREMPKLQRPPQPAKA